jgi:Allophanate hydrolase subunit 1
MRDWSFQPYGPHAWLVRFGRDLSEETMCRALSLARDLAERRPEGLSEFTMGYGSVLLECAQDGEGAARWGRQVLPGLIEAWRALEPEAAAATRTVEIPGGLRRGGSRGGGAADGTGGRGSDQVS